MRCSFGVEQVLFDHSSGCVSHLPSSLNKAVLTLDQLYTVGNFQDGDKEGAGVN